MFWTQKNGVLKAQMGLKLKAPSGMGYQKPQVLDSKKRVLKAHMDLKASSSMGS